MSTFATVSAKLGKVKPETKSIAKEIYDAAKKAGHEIWYMWGNGTSSEHATGLALDLMVRSEADGDWVRNYIWANRARLRLQHVIWEQHITSTVTEPGVRRKMADRGNTTENHMDHNHVLFFAGKYQPPTDAPDKPSDPTPDKKTINAIAKEVILGKWGDGPARVRNLVKAGYDHRAVQAEVHRLMTPVRGTKTVGQVASEVILGKWGNGEDRIARLKKAGYNPRDVQREVDRRVTDNRPSVGQLAEQVIAGKWGNGEARVKALTKAGYNAKAVQDEVDRRL